MRILSTKSAVFIPKWGGNASAPDADTVRVHFRSPTLADRRALIPQPKLDFKIGADGKPAGGVVEMTVETQKFVEALVERIEGLSVEDEAGTVQNITTAAQLLSGPAALAGLVDEIGQYLQAKTTGATDAEKKS